MAVSGQRAAKDVKTIDKGRGLGLAPTRVRDGKVGGAAARGEEREPSRSASPLTTCSGESPGSSVRSGLQVGRAGHRVQPERGASPAPQAPHTWNTAESARYQRRLSRDGWTGLTEKTEIIDELDAAELLLPQAISEALLANDQVKYLFTLVQNAKAHADSPDAEVSNLRSERLTSGVADEDLDGVTKASTKLPDGRYSIPLARKIFDGAVARVQDMMRPLRLADSRRESYEKYRARLEAVESAGGMEDETVSPSFFALMTSGASGEGDSLHLIVMDLHREINALQATVYQESVDGASVYGVSDHDRALISAFMKGVNQNAKLKFDHPGLGTTATTSGGVLMIQNDIGQTDAHVIVIKVKGESATITYTDVHRQRLIFFQSMLERFGVSWTDAASRDSKRMGSSSYYLSTGVFRAKKGDTEEFLTYLGSRLVFLIDWNRARKQVRLFLPKGDVFDTLMWAADHDHGHMAFLKMGGDKLVLGAVEQSANAPLRFGDSFSEVLGRKRAADFFRFVFATCSQGLLQAKPEVLIRDEVRAELAECFHSVNEELLEIASGHSALVVELATSVRDDLVKMESDDREFLKRTAERGKKWESQADALLNKVRLEVKRTNAPPSFVELLSHSDDAADSLEDSLFLLTLGVEEHVKGTPSERLLELAEIAARASMEYLKAVENAKVLHRWSPREEMEDFLEAVDKVLTLEHDADDALRAVKQALTAEATDFKEMQVVQEVANDIEQSTDALMKCAITLKDYILKDVMGA